MDARMYNVMHKYYPKSIILPGYLPDRYGIPIINPGLLP
jgi:hypothetical protein